MSRPTFESVVETELTALDAEERFREMVDELYDFEAIGGPFGHMQASRVLEEMDPIAFRVGVSEIFDGDDNTEEVNGEYYDAREVADLKERYEDGEFDEDHDADADETEDDEDDDEEEG